MPLRVPRDELRAVLQPQTQTQRNVRNVLVDGIGVGIVTGVGSFLPVFLARLGASSLLVGLITSLPALTGALLAVPIGRFLERQRNIVPWYSGMRVWVLWSYAVFGLLPFLLPHEAVPWAIIGIWALVTVPSTVVNVAFTVVMGSVAGPRHRFALMSLRWSSLGAVTAITVTLVGLLLERIAFPLNYQVVFIGSFMGGLLSFLFSRSIVLPDKPHAATHATATPERQEAGADSRGPIAPHQSATPPAEPLPEAISRSAAAARRSRLLPSAARLTAVLANIRSLPPAFVRFAGSAFVFRCGVAMAIPLLPLYWVREVGASDAWIGIISTASSGVLLVAYSIWSLLTRRIGVGGVLLASSFGIALYPIAVASTDSVLLLALFAGIVGFFAAGNDLVNFDLVLSTIPATHQAIYIGAYQTLQNTALFLMPLAGTLLADSAGIRVALITAGLLRLIGAGLYLALGLGRAGAPRPVPAR